MSDIIEGRNPVTEALRAGREIDKILVAKGAKGSIEKIKAMAYEKGIMVQYTERAKLNEMSQTGAHQGVIAIALEHSYSSVEMILSRAREKNEPPLIVLLDEITDPHNLGSVLRTADAAGAHGVIIPKRKSAGLGTVVSKVSAGAAEYMPVARVSNIAQTIDRLKEENIWIYGAHQSAATNYTDADFKGAAGLVIGSEGKGIGRLVCEKCDMLVSIPMRGKITSLNASVAAGVLLYEAVRQRMNS